MRIRKSTLRGIVRRHLLEVKYLANDVVEYDDGHEAVAAMRMKTSGFSTVDEYDQGIALMARIYSDGRAAEAIYRDLDSMSDLQVKEHNLAPTRHFGSRILDLVQLPKRRAKTL